MPIELTIASTGTDTPSDADQFADASGGAGNNSSSATVSPALYAVSATSVLQSQNDIAFLDTLSLPTGADLTAQAGRSISVQASILAGSGSITLVANNTGSAETDADGAALAGSGGTNRSAGAGSLTVAAGVTISSAAIKLVSSGAATDGGVAGNVELGGSASASGQVTVLAGGAITQSAGASISVPNLLLSAATGVSLTGGNNAGIVAGGVSGASAAFSYVDLNALEVGTVGGVSGISASGGPVSLTAGALTLAASVSTTGSLNLTASGAMTQSGGSVSGGATSLIATGNDITLTQSGNDFGGSVTGSARNVSLVDSDDITLGAWTATGSLSVVAGGAITVTGNVSIGSGLSLSTSAAGTINGILSGTGGLAQTGSGTTTINGTQAYEGLTLVRAGTLLVEGSIAPSNLAIVSSGATLGGSGTTANVSIRDGATLSPGSGVGTLSTRHLSFAAGATFAVELGGTGTGQYDKVSVTGAVTLGGATLSASFIDGFKGQASAAAGLALTIISNDESEAVNGRFSGLDDDEVFLIGTARFTISYDGGDGNDVVLTALNDAPVAVADAARGYQVNEDGTLTVASAASGVLGNDSDPEGDTLTASLVSGPGNGALTLNPDGTFAYTPDADYFGTDSFTYRAFDGAAYSAETTVSVVVNAVTDTLTPGPDEFVFVAEDPGTLDARTFTGDVLANDASTAAGDLVVSEVNGEPAKVGTSVAGSFGTVTIAADGSYAYRIANTSKLVGGETGADAFSYEVTDSQGNTGTATIVFTIAGQNLDISASGPFAAHRGSDTVRGSGAADRFDGLEGDDTLTGNGGSDRLTGGAGADVLSGGGGDDRLAGGTGDDRLIGGKGADDIFAGVAKGSDTIVFTSLSDTGKTSGNWDRIFEFDRKNKSAEAVWDRIDLSALDADSGKAGDQAFRFEAEGFDKAKAGQARGQVTIDESGDGVKVRIDYDGDSRTDDIIQVLTVGELNKVDFIL